MTRGGSSKPTRQDYIRSRAARLSIVLDRNKSLKSSGANLANHPIRLTSQELKLVSRIVGKQYESGVSVKHRLYDDIWASSVRFVTRSGQYTEANAGSGETAVVQIVQMFESAKENSLLLLDEPETSLHPGAQHELLKYILEQILEKKLQVLISTHAPAMAKGLPTGALKLLRQNSDGMISIDPSPSIEEAFFEIGQPFDPACNVVVEDHLTKQLLDAVSVKKGPAFAARLRVEFSPGGASEMKRDIAVQMRHSRRPVYIFDGDEKVEHFDPGTIQTKDMTPEKLDEMVKKQVNQAITFPQDSNMTIETKTKLRTQYLQFFLDRVMYLPLSTPEQCLWNNQVSEQYLKTTLVEAANVGAVINQISKEANFKAKFRILAEAVGLRHPRDIHGMFLVHFTSVMNDDYKNISLLLDKVVNAAGEPSA